MTEPVSIKGLQEVQAAALKVLAELRPEGALGKAVQHTTAGLHRYATAHTVVDTGSWRASHRPEGTGLTGRVFLDPRAVNPHSGSKPSIYGAALEKNRGGRYAVYKTTYEEAGPGLLDEARKIMEGGMP